MKTDNEIKAEGVDILLKNMDLLEVERFISLIQRDKFDYTKWQRTLWANKEVDELSKEAMEFYVKSNKDG